MIIKNIVPRVTGEGSLGTSTKKWAAVYANDIPLIDTKLADYTTTSDLTTLLAAKLDSADVVDYTSGTGINVANDHSINLTASGVTAGNYGPSADVSGANGTTVSIPQITIDTYGRVTSITNRTLTNSDTNSITGVKGSAESTYRTGNVEITAANLGISSDTTTGGTQNSSAYPTSGALYNTTQTLQREIDLIPSFSEVQRSTAYEVGDMASVLSLEDGLYLQCIEAGTTAETEPTEYSS